MKAEVLDMEGKPSKKVELPAAFESPLRTDLVRKAFKLVNSHGFQPKGRDPMAGERTTAETHSPPTGTGQSRIPRVKGERYARSGLAGGVASVVKGRRPHPSKSEKVIHFKINRKERRLATWSAIAFTASPEAVAARGHRVKKVPLPMVVSDELEAVSKTKDLLDFFGKAGLEDEMTRVYGSVKRNSGKRVLRGRVYRNRVGPIIVLANDRGVAKAASAVPGVDVKAVGDLSILDLAPGGVPGRLAIWTESSLEALAKPAERKEEETIAA